MPNIEAPASRSEIEIELKRKTPKLTVISFMRQDAAILFWEFAPLAVLSGGVVHHRAAGSAAVRAVNKWQGDAPIIRVDASNFDFIVGQVLTQAGLPLTRRVD